MLEKTRLEELSVALPENERKELLERITRRLEREEGDQAVSVELKEDEREKIIAYEMKRSSGWVRLRVWLRSLFSGRRPRDVFIDLRLRQIRSRIRGAGSGLTGFETRDLTPRFARRLWDLHLRLRPLLDPYRTLATDRAARANAYTYLVERRYAEAKKGLAAFVPSAEMEDIYAETGRTEDIRKRLAVRLAEYARGVPETLIVRLEGQCAPHLALGRLATFPFATLFRYFNHVLDEGADQQHSPAFDHAPAMLTLDLLERLYVPLSLVRALGPDPPWAPEPLVWWHLARAGRTPDAGESVDEEPTPSPAPSPAPSAAGEEPSASGRDAEGAAELGQCRAWITELCREVEAFDRAVPLLDIVRYFRRDPWYSLVFNPPRLYLRSLYTSALKARLGEELERDLGAIKERVINRRSQELLKTGHLVEMQHYKTNPGFDCKTLGLPGFVHVRSLTLLLNYLLAQYKGGIQEATQLLSATALAGNRLSQNRLGQHTGVLEDLEARIALFDRSLAPDEDDGRQLARYRLTIATDALLQKSWRGFVAQKDREARALIEKGVEALAAVRAIMEEARTSPFENTRAALKVLHSWKGRSQTLGQVLAARSEAIGAFLSLMDQLRDLEKGG